MDHLLDAALANANPGCKLEGAAPEGAAPLDQKLLLERMRRSLLEKHEAQLAELQADVETQEAELGALATQFA